MCLHDHDFNRYSCDVDSSQSTKLSLCRNPQNHLRPHVRLLYSSNLSRSSLAPSTFSSRMKWRNRCWPSRSVSRDSLFRSSLPPLQDGHSRAYSSLATGPAGCYRPTKVESGYYHLATRWSTLSPHALFGSQRAIFLSTQRRYVVYPKC